MKNIVSILKKHFSVKQTVGIWKRIISLVLCLSMLATVVYPESFAVPDENGISDANEASAETVAAMENDEPSSEQYVLPFEESEELPEESENEIELETLDEAAEIADEDTAERSERTVDNDGNLVPSIFTDADPKYLINFPFEGKMFATGTYYRSDVDFTFHNAWFDYDLTREYSTRNDTTGMLGKKWKYSFEYSLTTGTGRTSTVRLPSGKTYRFTRQSSSPLTYSSSETYDTLTYDGTYYYYKVYGESIKYKFRSSGAPIAIVHETGAEISLSYNNNRVTKFTDPTGNEYTVTYTGDRIASIHCQDTMCQINYAYTSIRGSYMLSSVNANGKILNYTYDSDLNMTGVVSADNQILESMEYYTVDDDNYQYYGIQEISPKGALKKHTNPYGIQRTYSYTYDYDNQILSTTDLLWNYDTEFTIKVNEDGDITDVYDETTHYSYTYDSRHSVTSMTDWYGGTIQYIRNTHGDIEGVVYPDETRDSYTYNAEGKLTSIKTHEGKVSLYVYDGSDNISLLYHVEYLAPNFTMPVFEHGVNTSAYSIESYNYTPGSKLIVGYTDNYGHYTHYNRDADGNIVSARMPDIGVYTYTYNSQNRVESETTPLGYETDYEYDGAGHVVRKTFVPQNAVTRYVYDSLGRLKQEISADIYDEDLDGMNGSTPNYSYGDSTAGIRYIYSGMGTDSYTRYNPDGSSGGYGYTYFSYRHLYSKSYFQKASEGDLHRGIYYSYDPFGRLMSVSLEPTLNAGISYEYEACDDYFWEPSSYSVAETRREANGEAETVTKYYNCHDQIIAAEYYDGTTEYYLYDLHGNITQYRDRNGRLFSTNIIYRPSNIEYITYYSDDHYYLHKKYDYDNRLISTGYSSNGNDVVITESYSYGYDGRVLSSDVGELHTEYEYDEDGNIIAVSSLEYTAYGYDYNDSTHEKVVTEYKYTDGNTLFDETTGYVETLKYYDEVGNLVRVCDPNGNVTVNTYDECGHMLTTAVLDDLGTPMITDSYT